MEQKKTRVDYTITIKGSDGSVKELATTNFVLIATHGDSEGTKVVNVYQANFFDLIGMYASLVNEKEHIEKINKLVPALYNAGRELGEINKEIITREKVDVDGGVV